MYGGNFVSQNRLGQLVAGRKFTLFALFYFVFEGKFQVQAPRRAYVRKGYLTEGFLRYDYGGFIFGGDYTWRGLFSEFYGIIITIIIHFIIKMIKMIIIVIVVLIIIKLLLLHSVVQVEEHIRFMSQLVPEWISVLTVRKCAYVKINKTADVNNVINKLITKDVH